MSYKEYIKFKEAHRNKLLILSAMQMAGTLMVGAQRK